MEGTMSIKYWAALLAAPILMASSSSFAAEFKEVFCGAAQFLRASGTEHHATLIVVKNTSPDESATWARLTFYDTFGVEIWDSGPASTGSIPHPPNPDFNPALDVTNIPPRASVYLNTKHVFGFGNILGDVEKGYSMQAYIRVETEGDAENIDVRGNRRARSVVTNEERMRMPITCRILNSGKIK